MKFLVILKEKNSEEIVFPAGNHHLFLLIKSDRLDVCNSLADDVICLMGNDLLNFYKTIGFQNRPTKNFSNNLGRDLTGFLDGSRNTHHSLDAVLDSAIITNYDDVNHIGGSYLYTSRFIHNIIKIRSLNDNEKNNLIGRDITKETGVNTPSNPQLSDLRNVTDERVRRYHINRGFGAMYRQSMPFIDGNTSGLIFIAFSGSIRKEIRPALERMAGHHDENGSLDALLDVSRSVKNGYYYIPTIAELELLSKEE